VRMMILRSPSANSWPSRNCMGGSVFRWHRRRYV
jgi:hypothetical protein